MRVAAHACQGFVIPRCSVFLGLCAATFTDPPSVQHNSRQCNRQAGVGEGRVLLCPDRVSFGSVGVEVAVCVLCVASM